MNIIVGSHVWVEDPALAWTDGLVTKINGQEVEIQRSDGKKVSFVHMVSVSLAILFSVINARLIWKEIFCPYHLLLLDLAFRH